MNAAPQEFARDRAMFGSVETSFAKNDSKKEPAMNEMPQHDAEDDDEPTVRQQQVLDYLIERIRADGLPPTVREIAKNFNIQPNAAYGHLKGLKKKNKVRQLKKGRRGYVPVVGRVCPCCRRNVGRQ